MGSVIFSVVWPNGTLEHACVAEMREHHVEPVDRLGDVPAEHGVVPVRLIGRAEQPLQ
jgi:hypothetical protein